MSSASFQIRLTLYNLLAKGYLPKELPPPFSTVRFAQVATTEVLPPEFTRKKDSWRGFVEYNLARPGELRRKAAVLNPLPFYRLAATIVDNQDKLFSLTTPSYECLSVPCAQPFGSRAISWQSLQADLPRARARSRVGKKFLVVTDIANFYPSIYTHSIDWAITGKQKAKKKIRGSNRLGATIDKLVQAAHNGQTRGIPVGPDSSLLLSHIILAKVDKLIKKRGIRYGFRLMDDYEFTFDSRREAEGAIAAIEESLRDYELDLNSLKTQIIELPDNLDNSAIINLRSLQLRESPGGQESDFIHLFNLAFSYAKKFPNKPILRYVVGRIRNLECELHHPDLLQRLILQCVVAEPNVWPHAVPVLNGLILHYQVDKTEIETVINKVILDHAPRGHSSEVANSLWAALVFEISITKKSSSAVAKMSDDICSLLLLHLREGGLASISSVSEKSLLRMATLDELRSEHWLLAYEALFQGWLNPGSGDYLASDPVFSFLKTQGVSFYDRNAVTEAQQAAADEDQSLAGDPSGEDEEDLEYTPWF